jgi:hypothetical protein
MNAEAKKAAGFNPAGLVVASDPLVREVDFGGGNVQKIPFREISDADWFRYYTRLGSKDEDVRAAARAYLVSVGVANPDGSQAMTLEEALRLKPQALKALETPIRAFLEESAAQAGNASAPGAEIGSGTS